MTRGDLLYKWFWYAMALLVVYLCEDLLFTHLTIFGLTPLLLPLALAAVAMFEGSVAGGGFGLAVGLLCSASWLSAGGGTLLFFCLCGTVAGAAVRYGIKQNLTGCLLCSAGILVLLDALRVVSRVSQGADPSPLLALAVEEILISLLFCPFVYLLFHKVYSKVGGTRLM